MTEPRLNSVSPHKRLPILLLLSLLLTAIGVAVGAIPIGIDSVQAQADNQVGILSVVGADGAIMYDLPEGEQVRTLSAGTALNATGRSGDNNWVLVTDSDGEAGWVARESLVLFGLSTLPVEFGEAAAAEATAPAAEEAAAQEEGAAEEATPTSAPTNSPTPTPSPSPTATATYTPSPTPPPTVTPTTAAAQGASSTILAVVRGGGAALVENPGGASVEDVTVGSTLTALAVSEDGEWIQVRTAQGATGWVASDQVIAFQLEALPRVSVEVAQPAEEDAAAEAGATAPAEDEAGSAAATPAATSAGTSSLPSVDTQIRRPAPEAAEGAVVASVAMSGSRLNIRSAPGTGSTIVGKALPDEQFVALARTEDSAWVQIEVPDIDAGVGWVSAQFVELNEPIADLPISDQPPVQTPPTPQAPAEQTPVAPDEEPDGTATPTPSGESARATGSASPAPGLTGRLAFQTSLGGSIYIYNLATGELRHLTGGGDPAISPDGSMVAFGRFGGDGGVYVINTDGTGERRLYASAEGPRSPKWSPDGKYILFSRLTGEYPCRYVGFSICLPNTPFTRELPLIRKDERGLTRIDLNGENFRDIPALNTAQAPDWTAAGIVYQATTSIEITYDTPEYEGSYVFNEIVGYQDPAWQPGGDRIIYQDKGPDHTEIWSVHPDGNGNRPLTGPVTTLVEQLPSNVSPAWSPDGRHIVYLSSRGPNESEGPWRLWVMDADGANKRPLPIDLEFVYHHNMEQMVSWGP